MITIDCISDLHGHYPKLEGGDLLIVAGDLTASDTQKQIDEFDAWLDSQRYRKKIFIAGNHDNRLIDEKPRKYFRTLGEKQFERFEYLYDSGTEFEGLKIWGSPWSLWFPEINPQCAAFSGSEKDLLEKYKKIPENTDILITHSPPRGCLDLLKRSGECAGSESLMKALLKIRPKLCVFGHIHEAHGRDFHTYIPTICVNASHVNERYEPVNKPIRVVL